MTLSEFFAAYNSGQRHFSGLDFEYDEGFSHQNFSDSIFENCFLYVDFSGSDLTNAQFIACNLKEADFRGANLANAVMTKCMVESTMFKGAIIHNFTFTENYYFGHTLSQKDFDERLRGADDSSSQVVT
jgi:uncharacterized protein YjbI with pentapeptide repeats